MRNFRGFVYEGILGGIGGLIGGGLIYFVLLAIWAGAQTLFAPDQTVWLPSTNVSLAVWAASGGAFVRWTTLQQVRDGEIK